MNKSLTNTFHCMIKNTRFSYCAHVATKLGFTIFARFTQTAVSEPMEVDKWFISSLDYEIVANELLWYLVRLHIGYITYWLVTQ